MARSKRISLVVRNAQLRAASIQSVDANLDLGNGLTLAAYRAKIAEVQNKLNAYNMRLSEVDALLNDVEEGERELRSLSAGMLSTIGAVYGRDSNEYEQAGGTRMSEVVRKRFASRRANRSTAGESSDASE